MVGKCHKWRSKWRKWKNKDEETSKFNEDFIKSYNDESDEGYFLEDDVQYSGNLHNLHYDLPFLPERMKIGKFEKLVANFHDKTEYVIHIGTLNPIGWAVLWALICTAHLTACCYHVTYAFQSESTLYLSLSILQLSKTVMYESWYDYVKHNLVGKQKLFTLIHTVSLHKSIWYL